MLVFWCCCIGERKQCRTLVQVSPLACKVMVKLTPHHDDDSLHVHRDFHLRISRVPDIYHERQVSPVTGQWTWTLETQQSSARAVNITQEVLSSSLLHPSWCQFCSTVWMILQLKICIFFFPFYFCYAHKGRYLRILLISVPCKENLFPFTRLRTEVLFWVPVNTICICCLTKPYQILVCFD